MQVYRYLDIGTAKPTLAERAEVPHHLIDCVEPDQDFSLAEYQERAYARLVDIQQRGQQHVAGQAGGAVEAISS